MRKICLFEDYSSSGFLPLTYFRTIDELQSGIGSLGNRITRFFPRISCEILPRQSLTEFIQSQRQCLRKPFAQTLFINARVQFTALLYRAIQKEIIHNTIFISGENIIAAYCADEPSLKFPEILQKLPFKKKNYSDYKVVEIDALFYSYLWDLIHTNHSALTEDYSFIRKKNRTKTAPIPRNVHLVNENNILIGKNVTLKPGVVMDAETGPIILGDDVTLMPNAVIIGPAYIGNNSIVKIGAKIYGGTSIGKFCKIGGEIEASIIQSFSNKQHDGFLGHSYVGSWVNLGADTNTSDLKNNYSSIRVQYGNNIIDTGVQFLGAIIGDHSKTGINVMLDTGTIIGVSSNIYGANIPPKFIPGFSWGSAEQLETYEIEKNIATARIVMKRRNVEMTSAYEQRLRKIFEETKKERIAAGIK